jgi:hypothetical protein
MRKSFVSIAILAGLIAFASLTVADNALAQHPIGGLWSLDFYWESLELDAAGNEGPSAKANTTLTINMNNNLLGTFETGDGGSGKVLFLSRSGRVFLIFETGYRPIYWGKLISGVMSGKMICRDSDCKGTWEAHRFN